MRDPSLHSFSPGRRWKIALNVAASVLALSAVLIMANYLAARHTRRFEWSSDARFQLSPVTKDVLRSVTNRVKVVVFYDRTKPLYDFVSDLLTLYQAECPKLDVEYVDYERLVGRARAVQMEYGLGPASEGDRIIFDMAGKHRVVYAKDLSQYDYGAIFKQKEVKLTGFKGEQLFTSAIFSLLDPEPVKIYFLQGHNEHDPASEDDQNGYLRFTRVLQEAQLTVVKLSPTALLTSDVPSDCQVLVIANPQSALAPEELRRIGKYLNGGGRLMVLFSWRSLTHPTGLEKVLADWGVDVGSNLVCEAPHGKADDTMKIIVTHFANHPIVNPLARSRILLIAPRSIGARAKAPQSADAPKVVELATTSPDGMSVLPTGGVERQGETIPLMVAVERGAIQGITADRGAARLVVAGDSYFLANQAMQVDGNRDFARNAINWLASRDVLVEGVGSRSVTEYRIMMTEPELNTIRWLFLVAFPGGVLFLGFLVWVRRRA
jgi:gliding motility-associatede transport system auxiliary component